MKTKNETDLFNKIFAAMGVLLCAVACWIGVEVAHLPSIEQKLDDYTVSTDTKITDHETRLRTLEQRI